MTNVNDNVPISDNSLRSVHCHYRSLYLIYYCKLLGIALSIDLIQLGNFQKGDVLSKKFNLGRKRQFFTKK
jgi:hypothetical protein